MRPRRTNARSPTCDPWRISGTTTPPTHSRYAARITGPSIRTSGESTPAASSSTCARIFARRPWVASMRSGFVARSGRRMQQEYSLRLEAIFEKRGEPVARSAIASRPQCQWNPKDAPRICRRWLRLPTRASARLPPARSRFGTGRRPVRPQCRRRSAAVHRLVHGAPGRRADSSRPDSRDLVERANLEDSCAKPRSIFARRNGRDLVVSAVWFFDERGAIDRYVVFSLLLVGVTELVGSRGQRAE